MKKDKEELTNEQLIRGLIQMVNSGEVKQHEADAVLDKRNIVGTFEDYTFEGYDFDNQKWLNHRNKVDILV